MKKIMLICHLDDSKTSGQQTKTIDIINELKEKGFLVDIFNYGKMNAFKKYLLFKKRIKKADSVILMPGGRRALSFYCNLLLRYRKTKDVHYLVVGGWINDYYSEKAKSKTFSFLKTIKGIYLQNQRSVDIFKQHGFNNCYCVPTFSNLKPLSLDEFVYSKMKIAKEKDFHFCYFARVSESKGIFKACESIIEIQEKNKGLSISLDVFGEFQDEVIRKKLLAITSQHKEIRYLGILSGDNTIQKLSSYYCMLFPTFYPGEGTPHTIVESFMSGTPVIASDWKFNKYIVKNKSTGLVFDLNDKNGLLRSIEYSINRKADFLIMRDNCFNESKKYSKEIALEPLFDNL